MEILGTKYQSYIDDKLVVYRLVDIKNDNKFILLDKNKNKVTMNKKELDKCIKLENDAFLNLMSTEDTEEYMDMYACVHKLSSDSKNSVVPTMILRQNTYSTSKNTFGQFDAVYVGDCVTNVICPDDNERQSLIEFENIKDKLQIALYADDKLNDIFECIPKRKLDKFDEWLHLLHTKFLEQQKNSPVNIVGYCDTLKELFTSCDFMYHYRSIFNIIQVDFPIDLGNNSSDDGVIILNDKQINRIEDILRSYITNIKVLKYDNDIDISKLINIPHIMVSDSNENIYLITFEITAQYPIDNDIVKAMTQNI